MFEGLRWKHRVVRDLAWVIASPPLASGEYDGVVWWDKAFVLAEYQACLPILETLDQDPSPLIDYLDQQKSRALGHRFEAFVAYWIEISPNFELLHRSVQLHSDGRTLGELDFILRDNRTQKVIHLEVAVKFYMGLQPLDKPANWYGPNLKDSLAKKLNHLKANQTQLSLKYPEMLPVVIDQRCCCVKGRLFYSDTLAVTSGSRVEDNVSHDVVKTNVNELMPESVAEYHLHGVWGTDVRGYMKQVSEQRKALTAVPIAKPYWFAQLDLDDIESLRGVEVAEDRAQCFLIAEEEGEVVRYFQFPEGYFDSVSVCI